MCLLFLLYLTACPETKACCRVIFALKHRDPLLFEPTRYDRLILFVHSGRCCLTPG